MSDVKPTILVVDDDLAACNLLSKILRAEGYDTVKAQGGCQAFTELNSFQPDLIISDIKMPDVDGYAVLERAQTQYPETPVILLTAFGDVDGAMEAIRKGAHDYLPKPYKIDEVKAAAARALAQRRHLQQQETGTQEPSRSPRLSSIVGRSSVMLEVYKMVARIARSDVSVLISGESGTGKELVARAIHTESERSTEAFVAVNCAGLAEGVLESELFGHERGAFTGATQTREGLFEQAKGGTLFLDEIGTIGAKMQTQLLRVLQEGEIRRVGGNATLRVDVRILSATNRDLVQGVEDGSFRDDLYYRLNVVSIQLPPLRARKEDISPLVDHFIALAGKQGTTMAEETMAMLEAYHWPGNVRELENTISRALALCQSGVILPTDLPPILRGEVNSPSNSHIDLIGDRPALEELTRRYARLLLNEEGGNKSKAANRLGIDRKTLYRLISDS